MNAALSVTCRTVAVGLAICLLGGCLSPDLFYFLQPNRDQIDPQCHLVEKKRDEKSIVVLSYADSGLRFGFDDVDAELCGALTAEIARTEARLKLVPERKVRDWKDLNSGWHHHSLQEIGEHFDVDYVIFVEVTDFTLNQTNNQLLLQASTEVLFKVHDVNTDTVIFNSTYTRDYPKSHFIELTSVPSTDVFRQKFVALVAKELSWYVVPHSQAESVARD